MKSLKSTSLDRSLPSPSSFSTTTISATMSSLRHHRVIIASLFLPNTAVLGDSAPSSPDEPGLQTPGFAAQTPSVRPLVPRTPGPLKSIVEDLKDKVRSRSDGDPCILPIYSEIGIAEPGILPRARTMHIRSD